MCTKEIRYGDSAYAGRRSSPCPIEPLGRIGTRRIPLATPLVISMIQFVTLWPVQSTFTMQRCNVDLRCSIDTFLINVS